MKLWQRCRIKIRDGDNYFVAEISPTFRGHRHSCARVLTWKGSDGQRHSYRVRLWRRQRQKYPSSAVIWRTIDREPLCFSEDAPYYRLYLETVRKGVMEGKMTRDIHGRFAPRAYQFRARIESYPWRD